jgi:hypothetical protein
VLHSIITGPGFLYDGQTIKRLSFLIFLRQVYCNLIRFDLGLEMLLLINSFTFDANNCRLFSISSDAGGGFQGEGM